jgi:hypothetical protein
MLLTLASAEITTGHDTKRIIITNKIIFFSTFIKKIYILKKIMLYTKQYTLKKIKYT